MSSKQHVQYNRELKTSETSKKHTFLLKHEFIIIMTKTICKIVFLTPLVIFKIHYVWLQQNIKQNSNYTKQASQCKIKD